MTVLSFYQSLAVSTLSELRTFMARLAELHHCSIDQAPTMLCASTGTDAAQLAKLLKLPAHLELEPLVIWRCMPTAKYTFA